MERKGSLSFIEEDPSSVDSRNSEQRDPGGDFGNGSAPENNGFAGRWSGLE